MSLINFQNKMLFVKWNDMSEKGGLINASNTATFFFKMIFDILLLNNWYTCEFTNINVHKKIISLSFHGTHAMCHLSGLIESFFFLIIDKSKNMIYLCRMMAFREHYHALLKKSISFLYCGWNIVNKSQN